MVYLLYFCLALATLFLAPWVGDEWLAHSKTLVLCLPLLLIVPHGFAYLGRRLQLRGRLGAARVCERLLSFSPVYLQAIALFGLGGWALLQRVWPAHLGQLDVESIGSWPELGLGLALTPYFVFQVLVIDARARLFGAGLWVRRARAFQLRMFLSMLVPFGLIALVSALLGWNEIWSVRLEEVGLLGAALGVALMLVAMLLLPRLLTLIWSTQSLPMGGLRLRLEGLAQRAGLEFRDLMIWRTEGLLPNALIVGFSPGTRRVLLTDALIELLDDEELEAVFAHEMGHARGHHGLLLGAFAIGAMIASEVLASELDALLAQSASWYSAWLPLGILLLLVLIWARSFGAYSRLLEMDADLESLRSTGNLHAIVSTLFKVTDPDAAHKSSWRHPSTAKRVAFLLSVANDAGHGERLKQRLGWMRRSALLLCFAALAYRGWNSFQNWDRDWLVSDLRLGHYQAAQARLDQGGKASDELSALVQLAAGLGADRVEPDAMLAQGLVGAQNGDLESALGLTELSYLRGRRDVLGLLDAMQSVQEGEALGEVEIPEAWRLALLKLQREPPALQGQ